jgi:hypothetical protein
MWSSRARVSLMSLSLPVPVSVYLAEKSPVLRTDKLRRFVAILADAFKNHCEFSAGLRKSEAVPLGDPVVPVLDGFVG